MYNPNHIPPHHYSYRTIIKLFFAKNPIANTMSKSPVVLSVPEWAPSNTRFMQPKVNERGGKSISIISGQSNRGLHISLPFLNTWGVSDYVDEKTGESDGKYSISISFPSEEYATPATRQALEKLKEFENHVLDAAVKNSEVWWGEEMSREVAKHTFFPFLKYSRNKDTKKIDTSKPPTIRAKVPFYDGRWNVEVYNTKSQMEFPCDDESTPMDHIPARSQVACVLQCGGIWIGGKGWGLTWKLFQCVVKKSAQSVALRGVCNVHLDPEDLEESSDKKNEYTKVPDQPKVADQPRAAEQKTIAPPKPVSVAESAQVESDDEQEPEEEVRPATIPAPIVVAEPEPEPEPAPVKKVVKKVVKKAA